MRILAAKPHYFWHRPQSARSTCGVRPYGLTERQIGFYSRLVRFVHPRHFAQVPFAFRVFGGKQMTPGRLGAQNFAASGDLEPLRDCFASFAAGNWLRHEARKIDAVVTLTTSFELGMGCWA